MNISNLLFLSAVAVSACSALASDSPEYVSGKLLLPAVTADGQPGFFQDVVIESAGDNLWRVSELYEGIPNRHISQVELIKIDTNPVQIFLKIEGNFPNGCSAFGRVNTQLEGNAFELMAYKAVNKLAPGWVACTQAMVPFSETIPLPVYGLNAGTYTYSLNGEFAGTFTLDRKNSL